MTVHAVNDIIRGKHSSTTALLPPKNALADPKGQVSRPRPTPSKPFAPPRGQHAVYCWRLASHPLPLTSLGVGGAGSIPWPDRAHETVSRVRECGTHNGATAVEGQQRGGRGVRRGLAAHAEAGCECNGACSAQDPGAELALALHGVGADGGFPRCAGCDELRGLWFGGHLRNMPCTRRPEAAHILPRCGGSCFARRRKQSCAQPLHQWHV